MLRLIAAMVFVFSGTLLVAQDLDPQMGHLFAPCKVGLGALYKLETDRGEADPIVAAVGGAIRFYLIGLAHGRYGAADTDGYAKVYYYFLDQCSKDETLRIEAIGAGM